VRVLRESGFDVTGLWYNPNVHPWKEYQQRMYALAFYAEITNLKVIYVDEYSFKGWLSGLGSVLEKEKGRCRRCYEMRLLRTAQEAKNRGFDSFTTTLLFSKYQDNNAIKKLGEQISSSIGIPFLHRDFRTGWKEGNQESRKMGLYRQHYCGCIFSEEEK